MNRTATILSDSALLLLKSMQRTIEDAGRAIIAPARNEREQLIEMEEKAIDTMQKIQEKLREVEYLFGDLKKC